MHENMLPDLQSITNTNAELYFRHHTDITILLNDFLLRYLSTLYKQFDGDITLAIVLGEIAHHNISLHTRDGRMRSHASKVEAKKALRGKKGLLPCNPFSISEATGIPRETVRRKFSELQKMGYIDKLSQRSYVMTMSVSDRFTPDFNLRLFEGFRTLCKQMNLAISQEPEAK